MPRIADSPHQTIYDYTEYLPFYSLRRKKALLSYLTQPIMEDLNNQKTNRFSNSGIALSWTRVLNELGYSVDIINWNDETFEPTAHYDLVIFHGGKNFAKISKKLIDLPKIIYFSTGCHWQFHNAQEEKRLKDFKQRHGIKLKKDRYINDSEEPVYQAADGIIGLGNQFTRQTFKDYPLVEMLNNANYPDDHFEEIKKDYKQARQNFLFFAGAGYIHKGLDLLVDAFKDLGQNLYIVGPENQPFLKVYKKELQLPNIHTFGHVPMRTDDFYKIVDQCAYQIFPSCSEGQPGSVVEAMNQGLVPIISQQSGISTQDYGVVLDDTKIETIKKVVVELSSLDPAAVETMAKKVRRAALHDHNPEKFRHDLKEAIRKILRASVKKR